MDIDYKTKKYLAVAGLLAAFLVGTGEFLLHFDPQGRFTGYDFMKDISNARLTTGHFVAMAGLPFYFVGLWYVYLQLRPGNQKLAFITFLIASVGFLMGGVWMGSRATIASIVHHTELVENTNLVELYELRYESLLQVIRATTLIFSILFVIIVLKGRTHYRKWMIWLNPFLLILGNFAIYALAPQIGKFTMPIALNLAFFIFFGVSLLRGTREKI